MQADQHRPGDRRMSKIMITGGAGFIGLHLARRLVECGHDVDLLDSFARAVDDEALSSLAGSPQVRLLRHDLLRDDALEDADLNYDQIVHLAAIVGVAHVLGQPYRVLEDNVQMLSRVLRFARRQRALGRFVFASTSEVYAASAESGELPIPTPETARITLPDLALPRTSYMLSKLYGEAMCQQSGVPFTIVRPHNVYGPRMGLSHVIPELLQRAHAATDGSALEVFSVDHRRTFCYVDDAVEIIRLVGETPACTNQTLNLGAPGPEVSIGDVATLVVELVGKDLEVVPGPTTSGSPPRRCPDMARTTALTGFTADVPLETGVARTWQWYEQNVFEAADAVFAT
jgi:UDP-glucuronate decarboxylase